MTINAAYSLKMNDKTGSLEVGECAGMIVINRNITNLAPTMIADTKVLLVMVGGRQVYHAPLAK